MIEAPAGFEPHFRKSPVTDAWEPLYSQRLKDAVRMTFDVATAHCNSRGFLHGGVLAALCDNVMGLSLGVVLNEASSQLVTVNLTVNYMDSARLGDRVLIEPKVVRAGKRLGFCEAAVMVAESCVATAQATFSVRLVEAVKA
jgi:uncharacterized protein (TIGR00369 family)